MQSGLHGIAFNGRLFVLQPGVSNREIEDLVNDKVDAFWKGMERGPNKHGEVNSSPIPSIPRRLSPYITDNSHVLREATPEVMVSHGRGICSSSHPGLDELTFSQEEVPWEQWYGTP